MKIDIIQRASKYSFIIDGVKETGLLGRYKKPFFKAGYSIVYSASGETLASVRIGSSPWFPTFNKNTKLTYLFAFAEPYLQLEVTVQNYNKGYWNFEYQDDQYDFYRHKGHQRSLFRNDIQVARFDKRSLNVFENDKGYIIANSDENIKLLICLFLAFDMGEYNDAEVTWDIGYLTEGVKKINPNWQPWK